MTKYQYITQASICLAIALLAAGGIVADPQVAASRPIRIDIGPSLGRNDTCASGWRQWQVPDCNEATSVFDRVRITVRKAGPTAGRLEGQWSKKLLAAGAPMGCDGIIMESKDRNAAMEVILEGLPRGRHTLVTYHNTLWDGPAGPYKISVGQGIAAVSLLPSQQACCDDDVASGYVEFESDGEPVVVLIQSTSHSRPDRLILNGIEIDGSDPRRRALKPTPIDGDQHVDGDAGKVILSWQPGGQAVRHRVYLACHRDPAVATLAVTRPGADSPALDGPPDPNGKVYTTTTELPRLELDIHDHDSLLTYCWRVDEVDANGDVTFGYVWSFRVRHLAFPGAEGYGRFAIGGRAGRVYHVTNLNDSGPGSLREAVEAEGPRTVVFDVGGLITLKERLIVRNPFLTIAGQTAPGKGICIRNYSVGGLGCKDVVIRFIRVRVGDLEGKTLDGMGLASCDHCIIDHCSISWTQDEAFSSRGAGNITLQRCLISEALNVAGHANYKPGTQHGYAASIGGNVGSFHHNLLAHCAGRNWSLAGGLDKAGVHTGDLDIRNNVVYNWGHRTTDGGARRVNFVNNYYKPGPASRVFHVLKPERNPQFGPQDYFVAGNVMEGHYGPDRPLAGVVEPPNEPLSNFMKDRPFFEPHVTTQTALEAYESVLADVGCNVPVLDEHDKRVIEEVRKGIATYKGSKTGLPGLPDSQADVGGWEEYPQVRRPADWDTDGDGMPNWWESGHGLRPDDPNDGPSDPDRDGYTNLEDYLNWLAAGNKVPQERSSLVNL